MKRTPTPAQLAARERFAEMARSGAFKKKAAAARNPAKKTVSQKISQLTREGYPQKQAVAIALEQQRRGKVKTNPRKPTYRRTPYVAPDPDLAFTRAYDLLNNLDFEDVYYRERRISAAKGVRLNAALDRILDAMERLAKNMKP